MKIFTKSVLVAIAMMAGVTTANAQDDGWMDPDQWVEMTNEMWFQWADPGTIDPETKVAARCSGKAEKQSEQPVSIAWNLGTDVGQGAEIVGTGGVNHNLFADISEYSKLLIFGSGSKEGLQTRVMCNREINEGAWKQIWVGFDSTDPHWNADLECVVIDLDEFKTKTLDANGTDGDGKVTGDERIDDYVHLHSIKNWWIGGETMQITALYLWKPGNTSGIKTIKNEVAGDGAYYNLQGQRVDNPTKGLFIHNGKKVILK